MAKAGSKERDAILFAGRCGGTARHERLRRAAALARIGACAVRFRGE